MGIVLKNSTSNEKNPLKEEYPDLKQTLSNYIYRLEALKIVFKLCILIVISNTFKNTSMNISLDLIEEITEHQY